jgi:putative OPT family oligopeptide transporter
LPPPDKRRLQEQPPSDASAETTSAPPREFTLRGLGLGLLLAVILGAANAYLGLYAGMTVSASIPAAVISMAVLRILGGATVLENNVVQTIASAGEAVAAGAIFTFPALVILGRAGDLSYRDVTLLCGVGGAMGSLLIIVLRRAYILEERLPYPEGKACAQVLRSGDAGSGAARPLLAGGVIASAIKLVQGGGGLIPDAIGGARWLGNVALAGSVDLSAALLGIGYIVGIRIASMVLAGGAIAWLVAVPILSLMHPELHHEAAVKAATELWKTQVRFLGVGAMLTGGVTTLWRMRGPILRALAETRRAGLASGPLARPREETDIPASQVIIAVLLCVVVMFFLYGRVSGSWKMALVLAAALAAIGFFATAVAGYLTGLVGASNNPVSGVTLIVLLALALMLKLLGVGVEAGPRLAILAGAVVCVAAAMAGDSLHDLATGFYLGATPRALEYGVLIGALVSALVVAPILKLLIASYGIAGMPHAPPGALPAPQAFLMAQVVHGVFVGGLPWVMVAIGAVLALVLYLIDVRLESGGAGWRTPPMPLALGLYLPLGLSVAIAIGALVRLAIGAEEHSEADAGLLFSAGLVAGEALTGILIAAMVTAGVKLPIF